MLDNFVLDSDLDTDKIVGEGSITIVNDGATGQEPQTAKITTTTAPNTYGKACFVRGRWSVDNGLSWQSLRSKLVYSFVLTTPGPSETLKGLRAAVSVGCRNNEIVFLTGNGYHGNVSFNGVTYTFTPISQTFLIEYTLYEVGL